MPTAPEKIIVLAGPTATGKTRAAIELALRLDGELVGADSVQVYRGFDIGSAKPRQSELRGVAHHLIDVADPPQAIDAMAFALLADRAISEIHARDRTPIVVGGTGLWLRALLRGLLAAPEVDLALRRRLDEEAASLGTAALHARLASIDPRAGRRIHPNDQLRIVRALEFFEQTGRPMGEVREEHALGAPRYDALVLVTDVERDEHTRVIEARAREMIDGGFVQEVTDLLARWGPDVRAFGSVGYRQMLEHLRGERSLEPTRIEIVRATRVYARRQRTWFRSEPGVSAWTTAEQVVDGELWQRIARHVGR